MGGVKHQDTDVRILYRRDATEYRVVLNILTHLPLLSHTGGVHEEEVVPKAIVMCVDRVPRGAGDIGHDVAILVQ